MTTFGSTTTGARFRCAVLRGRDHPHLWIVRRLLDSTKLSSNGGALQNAWTACQSPYMSLLQLNIFICHL
jgi:hypothetical protein